jgi:hypothetical protein
MSSTWQPPLPSKCQPKPSSLCMVGGGCVVSGGWLRQAIISLLGYSVRGVHHSRQLDLRASQHQRLRTCMHACMSCMAMCVYVMPRACISIALLVLSTLVYYTSSSCISHPDCTSHPDWKDVSTACLHTYLPASCSIAICGNLQGHRCKLDPGRVYTQGVKQLPIDHLTPCCCVLVLCTSCPWPASSSTP